MDEFSFKLVPFVFGQLLWVSDKQRRFIMRVPQRVVEQIDVSNIRGPGSPDIIGGILASANESAPAPLSEGEDELEGQMIKVVLVGDVPVDWRLFAGIRSMQGEGLTWRSSNTWSPVFATRGGVPVAVVMPIARHGGDA